MLRLDATNGTYIRIWLLCTASQMYYVIRAAHFNVSNIFTREFLTSLCTLWSLALLICLNSMVKTACMLNLIYIWFSIVGLQPLHYLHDFLHDTTQIIHKEPYTVTQFFFYWFYFYYCYTNHFNVVRKADSSEKMN